VGSGLLMEGDIASALSHSYASRGLKVKVAFALGMVLYAVAIRARDYMTGSNTVLSQPTSVMPHPERYNQQGSRVLRCALLPIVLARLMMKSALEYILDTPTYPSRGDQNM
jgi:hypothetical protein